MFCTVCLSAWVSFDGLLLVRDRARSSKVSPGAAGAAGAPGQGVVVVLGVTSGGVNPGCTSGYCAGTAVTALVSAGAGVTIWGGGSPRTLGRGTCGTVSGAGAGGSASASRAPLTIPRTIGAAAPTANPADFGRPADAAAAPPAAPVTTGL